MNHLLMKMNHVLTMMTAMMIVMMIAMKIVIAMINDKALNNFLPTFPFTSMHFSEEYYDKGIIATA